MTVHDNTTMGRWTLRHATLTSRLLLLPAIAIALCLVACVNDDDVCVTADYGYGDGGTRAGVIFRIKAPAANSATRTVAEGEKDSIATELENMLLPSRLRFFAFTNSGNTDGTGTFIEELEPTSLNVVADSNDSTYIFTASMSEALSDFKLMVVQEGSDTKTDISSLTSSSTLSNAIDLFTYDCSASWQLSADNPIPMYGIQSYTGVTYRSDGIATELGGEINMLRAMAKVVVRINTLETGYTIDHVILHNWNDKGYTCPTGQYTSTERDQEVLHIPSGATAQTSSTLTFSAQEDKEAGYANVAVYIPEYQNMSDSSPVSDYAYMEVYLRDADDASDADDEAASPIGPYQIYFRDYSSGSTNNADYDIYRNHIYEYTITSLSACLKVSWTVCLWDTYTVKVPTFK